MGRFAVAARFCAGLSLLAVLTACPVTELVSSVTIVQGDTDLAVGESVELTAVVVSSPGADAVAWASLDPSVASVTALEGGKAVVTGENAGSTTVAAVSVTDPGKSDEIAVTVSEPGEFLRAWQFGTAQDEEVYAVAVDAAGNVYVAGTTLGDLGEPSSGSVDAFVRKHASDGTVLWTRQYGSTAGDYLIDLAVDAEGNAVVTGFTDGALTEEPSAGNADAFVSRLDAAGTVLWTVQFGTTPSDIGEGVTLDAEGNAVVTGWTLGQLGTSSAGDVDVFVAKFDPGGDLVWMRQFGTDQSDYGEDAAMDADGSVYVAGSTTGVFPENAGEDEDAFVAKLDADGELVWVRQFGSAAADSSVAVVADGSAGALVAGVTEGTMPGATGAGGQDMFVSRFDADGNGIWSEQFGTELDDRLHGMTRDTRGHFLVVGWVGAALPGQTSQGDGDAFVRKYWADGTHAWTRQFGTAEGDRATGVAVGPGGVAVVAGDTPGDIDGWTNQGFNDAFVRVYGR